MGDKPPFRWDEKAMGTYLEIKIPQKTMESIRSLGETWEKAKENEANMARTKSSMDNLTNGWVEKWRVPGSSGNKYTVALHKNGFYGCTCPAWIFQGGAAKDRKNCKHIKQHLATYTEEPKEKEWVWF